MIELRQSTGTSRAGSSAAQPDVSIVTSGHDIADARLHRHVAALTAAGMAVEVLALGDAADAPSGSVHTVVSPRPPLWKRLALAQRYARDAQGRVLISLDPESAYACSQVAKRSAQVFVADVHEDYQAVLQDRSWSRGLVKIGGAALARMGSTAARSADITVVADSHLMRDVTDRIVVRNVPDGVGASPRDATPRAVYVGDLRRTRGLFDMLEVLERCPDWTLDLVGPIAPHDVEEAHARAAALRGRVRIHGRMRPDDSWALADGAWVGFCMLHDTPAFREAAPSKVYEYMAHGIPVVATDLPVQARLVEESGGGQVVSGVDEAVHMLEAWQADPDGHADVAHRAAAWASGAEQYLQGSRRLAVAIQEHLGRD
ncbi:glycosyltransferase [Demequina sp. B12]|uniref:glycosyltransferase n=1 Tax=Demequina sp. B12 TaxID=2992757 RepID=UPI00237C4F7E|nr:glycosyltransferase [Demequina sp. B12]MDE0572315.1 glycosyltransferase [Demequina sp. B12]